MFPRSRIASSLLGIACIVVGVVLVTRPFTSLSVLTLLVGVGFLVSGVATILGDGEGDGEGAGKRTSTWWQRGVGVAFVAAGVAALAWPDITVSALAWLAGLGMIVGGVADLAAGLRGTTDERLASMLLGLASVVFGVLALAWPDVTVLVVAVVFGARLVVFGLSRLLGARHRSRHVGGDRRPGALRRFGHVLGAAVALVVALALLSVSAALHGGEPEVDAFYDPPDDVPAEPGVLLRTEPFDRGIPDGARAWRILYTTTRDDATPALSSGIVVTPDDAGAEPGPVIAWAHGTTGVDRTCAPSILPDSFGAGAFYVLDDVIERGWTVVATDYIGLGTEGPHPYFIGQGEGRSVLDAVRAARQLEDLDLEERTIVWGHSQGGGSALWAGQLADSYAPDVNVAGVAALAPVSDPVAFVDNLYDTIGGSIFASFVLSQYSEIYDDVEVGDYLIPGAEKNFRALADRCLGEPSMLVSIVESLAADMSIFPELTSGALGERLAENRPTGPISSPLLVAQGLDDQVVPPDPQAAYVEALCASGQPVDFRTYEGRDHVGLVSEGSPLIEELFDWTDARLAGEDAADTCED